MESYSSEEEQVEALKRWWDENGRSTITAIIVALALGFGWQGWQKYSEEQAEAASNVYQAMLQQYSRQNVLGAETLAKQLISDYAGTSYAQFAALHLARAAVESGDLAAAGTQLRWVANKADKGSETYRIAQLRLARVVAAQGQTEQALAILDSTDPGSFQASYQLARGDILLQQDKPEAAKEAYSSALMLASRGGEPLNTALLQEKLNSLSPRAPRPLAEIAGEAPVLPSVNVKASGASEGDESLQSGAEGS